MRSLNTFQIILTVVFALAAVVGLFFFALYRGGPDEELDVGPVVIWGTLNSSAVDAGIEQVKSEREGFNGVQYVEKDPRTFESELLNALAADTGPDLFLLPHENILQHEDKLVVIPFDTYSERTFKDTFIEQGELYLVPDGLLGLPYTVDPLIMYWNRDIFSAKGIASPPQYWDELFDFVPRVTERDQASNIVQSAVALGEFRNVRHAKEILVTLFMQAGTSVTTRDSGGSVTPTLKVTSGSASQAGEAALRFYTEFSNPVKSVYSWNRALPESRQSFLAGDLAIYFGFASEYRLLRQANPNLNFDVAPLPQSRDGSTSVAFGAMQGFVIPKTSKNIQGAFSAAVALTGANAMQRVSSGLSLPPVRRDLLSSRPTDALGSVLYDAALMARGWLDPSPQETGAIFQRMVESTISGRTSLSEAVTTGQRELSELFR